MPSPNTYIVHFIEFLIQLRFPYLLELLLRYIYLYLEAWRLLVSKLLIENV